MAANMGLGLIAQRIGSHLMLIFCCRLTGRCSLLFLVPLSISAPPKPPTCGSPADLLLPKEAGFSQRFICYSLLYADTDTLSLKDLFLNWVLHPLDVCNISVFCTQPSVGEIRDLSMLGTLKQCWALLIPVGTFWTSQCGAGVQFPDAAWLLTGFLKTRTRELLCTQGFGLSRSQCTCKTSRCSGKCSCSTLRNLNKVEQTFAMVLLSLCYESWRSNASLKWRSPLQEHAERYFSSLCTLELCVSVGPTFHMLLVVDAAIPR